MSFCTGGNLLWPSVAATLVTAMVIPEALYQTASIASPPVVTGRNSSTDVIIVPQSAETSKFTLGSGSAASFSFSNAILDSDPSTSSNITLSSKKLNVVCGTDLDVILASSCRQAWRDIPAYNDQDYLSFGNRTTPGNWDVPLPFRFISGM